MSEAPRVALVTGAASGIGAAAAELLVAEGAVVYAADLEEPDVQGATPVRLDVRHEDDWARAAARILAEQGRLDALVHAAGISEAVPMVEASLGHWRRVLETNLDGSFLAVREGMRAMATRGGSIVLVGSASGVRPSAGAGAYSTAKAGVTMLARVAAKEARDHGTGVRVNVVSPAGVRTPIWRTMSWFNDMVEEHGSEQAAFEAMEAGGGGVFADPAHVAACIAFLLSDDARHVTGHELLADGGYVL